MRGGVAGGTGGPIKRLESGAQQPVLRHPVSFQPPPFTEEREEPIERGALPRPHDQSDRQTDYKKRRV